MSLPGQLTRYRQDLPPRYLPFHRHRKGENGTLPQDAYSSSRYLISTKSFHTLFSDCSHPKIFLQSLKDYSIFLEVIPSTYDRFFLFLSLWMKIWLRFYFKAFLQSQRRNLGPNAQYPLQEPSNKKEEISKSHLWHIPSKSLMSFQIQFSYEILQTYSKAFNKQYYPGFGRDRVNFPLSSCCVLDLVWEECL